MSATADLAGGVTVEVVPSTVAEVASSAVIAEAVSSADLAGDITVGVTSSAVAGVASPADIAEVVSLAEIAEVASLADLAEVASSGYVTVGVTSSADTVNVSPPVWRSWRGVIRHSIRLSAREDPGMRPGLWRTLPGT